MRRRFFDSEATTKQRQSKADHLEAPVQVVMARSVEPDTPVWQGHTSGVDSNAELDTSLKPEKPPSVNPTSARFPFCVVWTPIPLITWLIPFIGHMGVCSSEGVIFDFAGPYFVSVDNLAFGRTARYMYMPPGKASFIEGGGQRGGSVDQLWDKALEDTARVYGQLMYNFCGNNCHEFVASFLNSMQYGGSSAWNMVTLAALMLFKGRFVSIGAVLWSWLPFVMIAVPVLYFGGWIAAAVYGGTVGLAVIWFILYSLAKVRWGGSGPRR